MKIQLGIIDLNLPDNVLPAHTYQCSTTFSSTRIAYKTHIIINKIVNQAIVYVSYTYMVLIGIN